MSYAEAQSLQEEKGMNEGFLKRKGEYNPDVLSCLANLSNDEVFTPPEVANRMLDLLPQKVFRDPNAKFLDIATKTGVFLREIAKRLMVGLAEVIPDENKRREHIFKKQLFGIAITELTALMSRRSVYCSKDASCRYSLVKFKSPEGNIRSKPIRHRWENGRCVFCGASRKVNDRDAALETHAYEFIHTAKPEEILNMHFDVVISNPPYQMNDGGNGASALPIYNFFVEQALKLKPRYAVFIIPSRWLNGGRGLETFRAQMLSSGHIRILHDFMDSSEVFNGVEIKGGVCYLLWDGSFKGDCNVFTHHRDFMENSRRPLLEHGSEIFIRSQVQVSIFHKVIEKNEHSLLEWLNAGRFFGFHTRIEWRGNGTGLLQSADGKDSYTVSKERSYSRQIKVYIHGGICWIARKNIPRNENRIDSYKVLIPRSGNPGFGNTIIGKPKISEPNSCSSNTYMVAIPKQGAMTKNVASNLCSYILTKFVRFLVATKTSTQSTPPDAFAFVPMQDFSKPWTDEELYRKYKLTAEEIAFIESMIRPMEV